jgi:hypothetical protein
MQNRTSLEGSPEEDGDGESDYEPRTEEDSIVANSPDIISEIASEVAEVEGADYVDEEVRPLKLYLVIKVRSYNYRALYKGL